MSYEDYQALMKLLQGLEDVRDILDTEGEPTRPLRGYLTERRQPGAGMGGSAGAEG